MTLTELRAAVYEITNRPDLVSRTLQAIQSATLKAHQMDFFTKDLFETGVIFDDPLYLQSLDYRTLIPRWRALKYIRKTDISGASGAILEIIPPELILDSYGVEKTDVVYGAGSVLQIKSSTSLQYIILGCYLNPDITESGYESWIALDHPFAIVYEAASSIFKMIGKTQEFAVYTQLSRELMSQVSISNILIQGY